MSQDLNKPVRRSKVEARNHYYVVEALKRLEYDLHTHLNHLGRIPLEWEDLHLNRSWEKTRITMRIDKDILKFFKSLGPGYQPRINDVLRAFMHTKLAGLIDREETITEYRDKLWHGRRRLEFGITEKRRAQEDAAREAAGRRPPQP